MMPSSNACCSRASRDGPWLVTDWFLLPSTNLGVPARTNDCEMSRTTMTAKAEAVSRARRAKREARTGGVNDNKYSAVWVGGERGWVGVVVLGGSAFR